MCAFLTGGTPTPRRGTPPRRRGILCTCRLGHRVYRLWSRAGNIRAVAWRARHRRSTAHRDRIRDTDAVHNPRPQTHSTHMQLIGTGSAAAPMAPSFGARCCSLWEAHRSDICIPETGCHPPTASEAASRAIRLSAHSELGRSSSNGPSGPCAAAASIWVGKDDAHISASTPPKVGRRVWRACRWSKLA
jgi:hypothetical protein